MNLVVAGLSPRDEAAFGFFLGRFMKNWSWQSAPADLTATLPKVNIAVLDLAALGMPHWSEAAQADLQRLLQNTPAVLLVPANDRTWSVMETEGKMRNYPLVWLARPYGTDAMRAALQQAATFAAQQPKATPAPTPASVPPPTATIPPVLALSPPAAPLLLKGGLPAGVFRPVVTVAALAPQSAVVHHPTGSEFPDEPGLSLVQLQKRLATEPDAGRYLFLRKLAEFLTVGQPFEARFTVQNSLIVNPSEGWTASNTPMMVIERVCKSDVMASAVNVREIDAIQAEERTHRLNMPLRELEAFLWDMVTAASLP